MPLYRIFIDECGNHDVTHTHDEDLRFLTLFGVILTQEYCERQLEPSMNAIKAEYFGQDTGYPVIFHRKEILKRQGGFACLLNRETCDRFDGRMLAAYEQWQFMAIAVTIDKRRLIETYGGWAHEPYYYCFKVLLERYVLFLHYRQLKGDVIIESRNPDLDKELARHFRHFYENGSGGVRIDVWQNALTSAELKVEKKTANLPGLQLADLLAHAAHYCVLSEHKVVETQTATFGGKVAAILKNSKFVRDRKTGNIIGYGMKLLP